MARIHKLVVALAGVLTLVLVGLPSTAQAEKRIALVIGNSGYQVGALTTPANDAGLIAQTLQAAGFDVVGARDLDQDSLRHAFRDFVEKATGSGTDAVAFIYVGGYGVQLEGENYFVPVDARIARDSDVTAEALRISDYTRPLAAMKLKASIVVIDAARANPFARSGPPLAGGLALVEPEPGVLLAFNSAPGTVAPESQGPYGPYAQALAEMIREGGLPLANVFERTRLRVNDMTKGAEVPWHASKVPASLVFFERAADAPPPAISAEQTGAIRARPIRDLDAQEAYIVALERDTLEGYSDFLAVYPNDPMARRVRAIIAARREAITWRRTRIVDTPPAYWSYLRRYSEGPHASDARRRLAYLAAAFEPPPSFAVMAYDLPPPPPEELIYIRRPVLVFDDPVFGFAPPPPAPVIFLAPPPPEFVLLESPPPPVGIFLLPMPIYRPVPVWVSPPRFVAPPPNNVIYNNVHNTVVVNNVTNTVTVTNMSGQTTTIQPPAQAAAPAQAGRSGTPVAAAPVAAIGTALPPSVAQKAVTLQTQNPQGVGTPPSGSAQKTNQPPGQPGQPLPGPNGQPLPGPNAMPQSSAPSAAVTPGTAPLTSSPRPGTSPPQVPAIKPTAPTSPSAAVAPGTPAPTGPDGSHALPPAAAAGGKPGTPSQATGVNPATPSAAITPGVSSSPPPATGKPERPSPKGTGAKPTAAPTAPTAAVTPGASPPLPPNSSRVLPTPPVAPVAKPGTPSQAPAAKLSPEPPSTATKRIAPEAAPGGSTQPPSQTPTAKLPPPSTPPKPVTSPPPLAAPNVAKPASPQQQVPAARLAPTQAPPPPPKQAAPPPIVPPAAMVKPVAPMPPPPATNAVAPSAPPPKPVAPAPAAAISKPAGQAPQPKGCPPGKTAGIINGQPVCN